MRDLPGWSTRWRPRHLAATSGWTLCRTLLCIRFLYDTTYSKMPDLWNQRGRNPWYEVDAKSLGSGLLEGNAQQTFGLDHTLFSITSDRKCYAMQATMLPVGKPLCQEFEITQFRDLSGKDLDGMQLALDQLDCLQHVALPLRLDQPLVPPVSWNLGPNKQDIGMAATRSWEFFCNVQSAVNVSNATRLMSQRPQREKLPASPDPLRCDDHVIKRVVWQFCKAQHTPSILEAIQAAITVAQQNYHAILECCSQSGNYLSQFRHDSVTHWTKGSFGQSGLRHKPDANLHWSKVDLCIEPSDVGRSQLWSLGTGLPIGWTGCAEVGLGWNNGLADVTETPANNRDLGAVGWYTDGLGTKQLLTAH